MTTNRIGLEQPLSDEQVENIASGLWETGGVIGVKLARELLEYRKASKEPVADVVAWNKPGEERKCDIRWRRFDVAPGPLFAAPQLQAVTVPDEICIRQAMVKMEAHDFCTSVNSGYKNGWNDCVAAMLKSVTNEP